MKNTFYLISFMIIFASCSDNQWEDAKQKNTLDAYEQYIKANPKGEFVKQADSIISVFKENLIIETKKWDAIKKDGTKEDFEKYIQDYPEGTFFNEAKLMIDKIAKQDVEDDNLWKQTVSKNTFYSYNDYIDLMPKGKNIKDAKERRNKEFKKLLDTDFKQIKDFFGVAELVISEKDSTISKDSLFTYFSSDTCLINQHEIIGGVSESSLIFGRDNFFYKITELDYFMKEYKKGEIDIYSFDNSDKANTYILIMLKHSDDEGYGELSIEFKKENGIYKIKEYEIMQESEGC